MRVLPPGAYRRAAFAPQPATGPVTEGIKYTSAPASRTCSRGSVKANRAAIDPGEAAARRPAATYNLELLRRGQRTERPAGRALRSEEGYPVPSARRDAHRTRTAGDRVARRGRRCAEAPPYSTLFRELVGGVGRCEVEIGRRVPRTLVDPVQHAYESIAERGERVCAGQSRRQVFAVPQRAWDSRWSRRPRRRGPPFRTFIRPCHSNLRQS